MRSRSTTKVGQVIARIAPTPGGGFSVERQDPASGRFVFVGETSGTRLDARNLLRGRS